MVWFLVVAKLGKTHLILLSFCIFQRLPKFGGLLKWTSVNSACLLKFEGGLLPGRQAQCDEVGRQGATLCRRGRGGEGDALQRLDLHGGGKRGRRAQHLHHHVGGPRWPLQRRIDARHVAVDDLGGRRRPAAADADVGEGRGGLRLWGREARGQPGPMAHVVADENYSATTEMSPFAVDMEIIHTDFSDKSIAPPPRLEL